MSGRWVMALGLVTTLGLAGALAAAEGAPPPSRCVGAEVNLNLVEVDLPEVVALMSKSTGRRFILGPGLAATKITILSPRPVCPAEAYDAFLSALAAQGLAVVRRGRFHVVMTLSEAVRSPLPVLVDEPGR